MASRFPAFSGKSVFPMYIELLRYLLLEGERGVVGAVGTIVLSSVYLVVYFLRLLGGVFRLCGLGGTSRLHQPVLSSLLEQHVVFQTRGLMWFSPLEPCSSR